MLPGPGAFNMQWLAFDPLAAPASCAVALREVLLPG
jgi:hypothetical protein